MGKRRANMQQQIGVRDAQGGKNMAARIWPQELGWQE